MKKKTKLGEWLSVQVAKNPGGVILGTILLFNIVFFICSALVISWLAPESVKYRGFWDSIFYTISMILDAGCIQLVIEDVGKASVAAIIVCLCIVIIGTITFTGAVIGYITNYISNFIGSANTGSRRLYITGHTVILNWNSRASEIVNDLLYSENPEKVVILVPHGKAEVERDLEERILDTMEKERNQLVAETAGMSRFAAFRYIRRNMLKNRLTVIVWEGDTFSTKKLNDISIKQAKAVIVLGKENFLNDKCMGETQKEKGKGDTDLVKTLIQVAELTGAEDSADNQKIIVEVEEDWTYNLVSRIIAHKEKEGKCNIVPVTVNQILGQILAQFCIMPELNSVYVELFSNKGAAFYSMPSNVFVEPDRAVAEYMQNHRHAIPLTCMGVDKREEFYYIADSHKSMSIVSDRQPEPYHVKVNNDYWLKKRNIVILGHNSKNRDIMKGFDVFRAEWNFRDPKLIEKYGSKEILNIVVIDDEENLEKLNYYEGCPYINQIVKADVYDRDTITDTINRFVDANEEDTSILILSDDMVSRDELDANALTYLIYVQDIIADKKSADPKFDPEKVDVVVEIIDPKNYDIVSSYSVNNIVISNRYISRMITQISAKEAIYDLYCDILTYDEGGYESKELYVKEVKDFFLEVPGPCSAEQLIRAVYDATPPVNKAVVLGYVKKGGKVQIFSGDQAQIHVEPRAEDKLIIFSNH